VARHIRQKSVHQLLFNAIDSEIRPRSPRHLERIRKLGIVEGKGVRQGMPLSPFLANLFLAEFDKTCQKRGLRVLRYADDLAFFAKSKDEALDLQAFATSELSKIELEIPELVAGAKSEVFAPEAAAEFLGVELAASGGGTYQLRLGQRQIRRS